MKHEGTQIMNRAKHISTVGQRLRHERERRNWSQEQLAQEIGTTPLSINRWEHDKAFPRPHHRAELCRVFNKSAEALFELREDQGDQEPEHFPIWNVPHLRNLYFTGRDAVLTHLHDTLNARNAVALTQPHAISGLGGIGKTQVAIEYAYRYRSEYRAVLWACADSEQSLVSDFVALAGLLHLPQKDGEDQHRVVNAVKRWLQTHTQWLLILDNADELELINDFLVSGDGHFLVTTRSSATGPHITGIEIEKMKLVEGTLLLLRRSKRLADGSALESITGLERSQAEEICALMDGLPLALDQAAAYIEENQAGLGDYVRLYRSHRADLLRRRGVFSARDYPHSVATTWSLSFGQLERAFSAAADLLRLCAFLHPDAIPGEMLVAGAAYLGPQLQWVIDNPISLDAAIGALRQFSLVRRNAEAKTLTIHRLVQMVLRDTMDEETKREWSERAVLAVSHAFPTDAFSAWHQRERYQPQALACTDLIERWDMRFSEATRLLSRVGNQLYEHGQLKEAESLCRRALVIREQVLGRDHPEVAQSLNDLAIIYIALKKFEQVEPLCLRALSIQEQALGSDHPDVAVTLNDLGMLYYLQGRYEGIEPLYQRALSIFESRLGPTHPYMVVTLNNLGKLYIAQSKYAEAEQLIQHALTVREQVQGHDHPDVANSLLNLATLYLAQCKYVEAEKLYQRALAIREQSLGPQNREVAVTLYDLARLVLTQQGYEEAEPFNRRAVVIYEQIWGPEHPDLACLVEEYAGQMRKVHREGKAVPLHDL